MLLKLEYWIRTAVLLTHDCQLHDLRGASLHGQSIINFLQMRAAYCEGSVDFVRDMHPDIGLMSFAETGVPAEAVSEGEWSYFVPLTDFKDTILANYKWTSVAKLVNRVGTPLGIVDVPRRLKANTKYIVVGDILETLVSASAL